MPSADGGSMSGGQSGQTQMPSAVEGVNGVAHSYEYPEETPEGPYRVLDQYHSKPRRYAFRIIQLCNTDVAYDRNGKPD